MPLITTEVNVALSDPLKVAKALGKAAAEGLGKSPAYVASNVRDNAVIAFQSSDGPCALCHVKSIGMIDLEHNEKTVEKVSEVLEDMCGIPKDRVYITFEDVARHCWGFNGKTFAS